jgi:pimeloyl-ACP methyl ester carboxylesterase
VVALRHGDSGDMAWSARAACRGPQAIAFFPPITSERKDDRLARERRAKEICAACAVRLRCLDHALATGEPHGIWGGLSETERQAIRERSPARRDPAVAFSGKRTWVQDRPAFYGRAGAGHPVLFLHGWALGQHTYRSVLERIAAEGCVVYAPGLPGFGGTADLPKASFSMAGYAEWVGDFLDHLEVDEPIVVVGHSFGGGVAIRFAHDHRDRIRSLVLVNAVGGSTWQKGHALRSISERPLWDWGIHFPGDVWPLRQATRVLPVIVEDFLPNMVRNPRAIIRVANLARRADLRSQLEELREAGVPITVLWATRDGIIPRESFEALCVAAGVEGHVVEGSHSWLLADPDHFGEVMTTVLEVAKAARDLELLAEEPEEGPPVSRARRLLRRITPG